MSPGSGTHAQHIQPSQDARDIREKGNRVTVSVFARPIDRQVVKETYRAESVVIGVPLIWLKATSSPVMVTTLPSELISGDCWAADSKG